MGKSNKIESNVLRVSDFLTEENIVFFPARLSKEKIFESLIGTLKLPDLRRMSSSPQVLSKSNSEWDASMALKAILDRERWGSTTIAPGLALPHARIPGSTHIAAAVGINSDTPQIYLLFFAPANNMQEHLAFLASVSSLFQTKGFLDTMGQLKTPASVLAKIRQLENDRDGRKP